MVLDSGMAWQNTDAKRPISRKNSHVPVASSSTAASPRLRIGLRHRAAVEDGATGTIRSFPSLEAGSADLRAALGKPLIFRAFSPKVRDDETCCYLRGFIADLWGAVKVARASSSGLISRMCRPLETEACQTRMVWLPSTLLFPRIRDEPLRADTRLRQAAKD